MHYINYSSDFRHCRSSNNNRRSKWDVYADYPVAKKLENGEIMTFREEQKVFSSMPMIKYHELEKLENNFFVLPALQLSKFHLFLF
jgi:hypothetical protein